MKSGWVIVLLLAGCVTPAPKPTRTPVLSKTPSAPSATKPRLPLRPTAAAPTPAPIPTPAAPPPLTDESPPTVPVLLSATGNLNDFSLLANGGWNANWYVGFNTCWVHRLPPAPPGNYARAFLGAKLGAMKTEPIPGRPTWERRAIPGEVAIAVASEPRWPQNVRHLLTMTENIPLAGDTENALDGVGSAVWFWVEVPVRSISFSSPNYVALYSPDDTLRDAARAPVLAAALPDGEVNTWLNNTARGQPPLTPAESLRTPIGSYEPALAIKLIPARDTRPDISWRPAAARGTVVSARGVLDVDVSGENIEAVWVEISTDTRTWTPLGRAQRGAPYAFSLKPDGLPTGRAQIRAVAKDLWEQRGETVPLLIKNPK